MINWSAPLFGCRHIFFPRMLNELAPYFTGTHNLEGKKKKPSRAWCQSSHQPAFSELCVHLRISLCERRRGYWLTCPRRRLLASVRTSALAVNSFTSEKHREPSFRLLVQLTPLTFTSSPPHPPPVFPKIVWMARWGGGGQLPGRVLQSCQRRWREVLRALMRAGRSQTTRWITKSMSYVAKALG